MSRMTVNSELPAIDPTDELVQLEEKFITTKSVLDSVKKSCDEQNARIKELMTERGITEFGRLSMSTATKSSLNEERAIQCLKNHDVSGIIKTKEYVDLDALESAIYNGELEPSVVAELETCVNKTEVVSLRIKKQKKGA